MKKSQIIVFKLFERFYVLIMFKPDGQPASQQVPLSLLLGIKMFTSGTSLPARLWEHGLGLVVFRRYRIVQ